METTTFDTMTRSIATSQTRRTTLRGLVAGAAGLVAGGVIFQAEDSAAKRRRRKKGKKKGKGNGNGNGNGNGQGQDQGQKLQPGQLCQSDNQCTTGYICAVSANAGNSDKTCSGNVGTPCGAPNGDGDATPPFCASGLACTPSGNGYICQPEK